MLPHGFVLTNLGVDECEGKRHRPRRNSRPIQFRNHTSAECAVHRSTRKVFGEVHALGLVRTGQLKVTTRRAAAPTPTAALSRPTTAAAATGTSGATSWSRTTARPRAATRSGTTARPGTTPRPGTTARP